MWLAWFLFEQSGNPAGSTLAFVAGVNSVLLLIPLSIIHALPAGQPRKTMTLVVLGLAGLALLQVGMIYQAFQETDIVSIEALIEGAGTFRSLFIFGIIGSQFLANYLAGQRPRR